MDPHLYVGPHRDAVLQAINVRDPAVVINGRKGDRHCSQRLIPNHRKLNPGTVGKIRLFI